MNPTILANKALLTLVFTGLLSACQAAASEGNRLLWNRA